MGPRSLIVCLVALSTGPAYAQTPPPTASREGLTLRATRLDAPLQIDGRLEEPFYRDVSPITGFTQTEPREGEPATERTDVWVAFDDDTFYVSFRNWESAPERVIAKEMRRDHPSIWNGDDVIAFLLDTFHDRRNGFEFALNSIGGRQDAQIANERQWIGDWNTVWDFSTERFDGGWAVEAAIPFKSLRYRPGDNQIWGFNAMRANRWKNELSFLAPIPKSRGQNGLHQASLAATLTGITAPSGSKNLEIKPYAIANASGTRLAGDMHDRITGDIGIDAKYGVTQNLTADFTLNTDFAQVEADQQQVNLTRFSLFFPEKREFFLENQGTFAFGQTGTNATGDTPLLFYSRRIGLERGLVVPIDGGARLTGRLGRYSVGVLNIQTDDEPAAQARPTNFSVVRLRRDILRRSSIGLLMTGRNESQASGGDNFAYGVDGTFAFFTNLAINTYWAQTDTRGRSARDNTSYRAQLDYAGDRYGVQIERLVIGDNFNPGVGFVRRDDMRKTFGQVRFSPRPADNETIRRFSFIGSTGYVENGAGRLETRDHDAEFAIEFQNADRFSIGYTDTYEYLPSPFPIASGITLPVGGYDFRSVIVGFNRAVRNRVAGNLSFEHGSFYNGERTTAGISSGRVNLTPRISLEPSYSVNWVDLIQGSFTTHLAGTRLTYTPTPFMFVSALLQYNSSIRAMTSNVRLRWEYRPGSELFVVYNDDRDTFGRGFPDVTNRAVIIKVNRLLRF